MNLYNKYRPTTLEGIKGNEEILPTLETMLSDLSKCPHSFLLTGPTGCGKTTLARIIAERVGCQPKDMVEMNISDLRGIDNVRDIIRSTSFLPMGSTARVWLLDEFHKATNDAQNALLKILEDTPDHVYFILCSTDPQKIISTIKGRCSTFQMSLLNDALMTGLLRRVARAEGVKLEEKVMEQIVQDSLGHPRNALNILEQVISTEPDQRLAMATKTAEQQNQVIELCRAMLKNAGWKEIRVILTGLSDQEPEQVRRAIMGYSQAVLLKEDNPKAGLMLESMLEPFYDSGFPGLTYACYRITKS
jgi:DNA polymerase III gamma/tau subunit